MSYTPLFVFWLTIMAGMSVYWYRHIAEPLVENYELPANSKMFNASKYLYFEGLIQGAYRGTWTYVDGIYDTNEKAQPDEFKMGGVIRFYAGYRDSLFKIHIYDGNYSDSQAEYTFSGEPELVFLDTPEESNSSYNGLLFKVGVQDHLSTESQQECNIDLVVYANKVGELYIKLGMSRDSKNKSNCSITFTAKLTLEDETSYNFKLFTYHIVVFLSQFILALGTVLQSNRIKENFIRGYRLSLFPSGFLIISNMSWLVYHILLISERTGPFFPMVLFSQVLSIVVFQYKMLNDIWKARWEYKTNVMLMNRQGSNLAQYCTSKRVKLALQFIIVLLFCQIIFIYPLMLLICCSLLWMPQIVRTYKMKRGKAPHPLFVIASTLSFITLPLYYKGYKHNFKDYYTTNMYVCTQLFISMVIAAVTILQAKCRYNIFIPKCFITSEERPYNYFVDISESVPADTICPICFSQVRNDPNKSTHFMKTPCDHCFHKSCLEEWMKEKLECPNCRSPLPRLMIYEDE